MEEKLQHGQCILGISRFENGWLNTADRNRPYFRYHFSRLKTV